MNKIKLLLESKKAKPGPKINPILGQYNLNIIAFCKDFNEKSNKFKSNLELPVVIKFEKNKIESLKIFLPINSYFIENATFSFKNTKYVTLRQIYEISKYNIKSKFNNNENIDSYIKNYCNVLLSVCKSMKINIYNEKTKNKL